MTPINAKLESILRTLAESPRGVKWLSANGYGTPAAVQFNLLALADMGYADAPDRVSRMSTCSFWISDKGRQYLDGLKLAESRSFVSRGPYVPGKAAYYRNDGLKHVKSYVTHGYCE